MKYVLIVLILLHLGAPGPSSLQCSTPNTVSQISWDSTRNWRLYKLQAFSQVFRIPADSLRFWEGAPLNDDSMHNYLTDCKRLPASNPAWMGCYLASYEDPSGHTKKVVISHYGGFFYSAFDKSYYEIRPSNRPAWLKYLSDSYVQIK